MNVESVDVVLNIDNSSSGLYHFITLDVDLDNPEKLRCIKTLNLPQIPEPTTCYLDTSCTRVECCVDVDFVPYSFHIYLNIDPCKQMITVGIEKFHRNISLTNYQWGVQESFWLAGVLGLSYSIEDFSGESMYLVSLNISVCFESNKPCHASAQILSNTWLKKTLCAWDTSYYQSNFSLAYWLQSKRISLPLPDYGQLLLFEDAGIAPYLQDDQSCPLYTPAIHSFEVPCHLSALCTGIECCVYAIKLNRDFHTIVLVDPCSYVVTVGIEDFVYNTSITEFSFESQYACEQNYVILENMMLPILQCSNNGGFIKEDFSLSNWKSERGLAKTENLTSIAASELFEYLGLSYYLLSMRCNHYSDSYSPSSNGWKSLCSENEELPSLSGGVRCNFGYTCDTVSCCVDVEDLGRTMEVSLSIDHCNRKLSLQLERLSEEISLVDYKWELSLAAWLVEKSLPKSSEILPDWAEVQLKQDLKIDHFSKKVLVIFKVTMKMVCKSNVFINNYFLATKIFQVTRINCIDNL
ncbi:unnamed protein product [Mytilus edulis]|uniref:Uncharacterized protein n=1 Tax=Mytilus edulis TaxID=6550 RepID=A0A8S3V9P3_MYTED|nr:unnamed protein product [Mytilus edulis]